MVNFELDVDQSEYLVEYIETLVETHPGFDTDLEIIAKHLREQFDAQ